MAKSRKVHSTAGQKFLATLRAEKGWKRNSEEKNRHVHTRMCKICGKWVAENADIDACEGKCAKMLETRRERHEEKMKEKINDKMEGNFGKNGNLEGGDGEFGGISA